MFEDELQVIPEGLDEMVPGPYLAAILSGVDVSRLSGHDRITVLRAHHKMVSHYQAQVYEDMASVSDCLVEMDDDFELGVDAASFEIRVALRLTRRAADAELDFALDLRQRLPGVWEAMVAGDIDFRRARTITHGVGHLSLDLAREVVDQVIDTAPQLTTGQLAARIRRLCVQVDPDEAEKRYEGALAERRLSSEMTDSGTANLFGLDLAPHRVAAVSRRINHLARQLRTKSETRTMDQLRADVFLDLLTGEEPGEQTTPRGVVDIGVDLDTLAELAHNPGELAGYGPVIADIARQITEQQTTSQWRWTVTDPDTGLTMANGTTRRRPTTAQRRAVQARDRTCIFPGCRMPATQCDIDHRIPHSEGGPTTIDHLTPACRHDHVGRHKHHWTYQPLPDGDHLWTSRLGHKYTTSGRPP